MQPGTACYEHEIHLNALFLWSAVLVKFLAWPIGLVLDLWGVRTISMLGCALFATGCLLLSLSSLRLDYLHYCGYIALTFGGTCVYIPSLLLCRVLPEVSSLVIAMMTAAFDLSALCFLILNKLHTLYNLKMQTLFAAYILVPVTAFLLVTTFYPDQRIPYRTGQPSAIKGIGEDSEDRHEQSIWSVLIRPDFWLLCLFTGAMTSRILYFIATLNLRLAQSTLQWSDQRALLVAFTQFFPLGGLIGITAIGQLMQSLSLASNTLILWLVLLFAWTPLIKRYDSGLQAACILIIALLRPYYYAVTNDLCARLFGGRLQGQIYGLVVLVTAIMNMSLLMIIYLGPSPKHWLVVLLWNGVRCCAYVAFLLPVYLAFKPGL